MFLVTRGVTVTRMTRFDIRFGFYGFLKSGYGVELILDRLM
jgi:hypothetical protein